MISRKHIRTLLISMCLLSFTVPSYAIEEYVSDAYKEIDSYFSTKDDKNLNVLLKEYQGDKYYFLIENYATKKIRRLIITNDLDFAMDAILVVIDNNLENEEAVEMYSTISEAFELQQQYEEEQALKKQKEEERVASLKEKQRGSAEKEYNSVKTSQGKAIFITGKEAKLSKNEWNFHFNVIPGFNTNQEDNLNSVLLGFGFGGSFSHFSTNLVFGADAFASFKLINNPITGEDNSLFYDLEILPKLSFTKMKWISLKAGFATIATLKPTRSPAAALVDTIYTPDVGIQTNFTFGGLHLKLDADYYLSSLWTDNINTALGFGGNISIPFAKLEKVNLNFSVGVKDYLFLKSSGTENRANITIALGAENVNK